VAHKGALTASAAYAPLANKLFANGTVSQDTRLNFADSLVFSRLFYNTEVWQAEQPFAIRTINKVYMQTLRSIAGSRRFKSGCGSDLKIRIALNRPCIECVLAQRRLLYAARLAREQPPALQALLQIKSPVCSGRITWVNLFVSDLKKLKSYHCRLLGNMPDPYDDPEAWAYLMKSFSYEWACIVKAFVYFESPTSPSKLHERRQTKLEQAQVHLKCDLCGVSSRAFATQKGLDTHMRVKHKERNMLDKYIDSSGVCPVCRVNFHTRVHVLRHVSEKRCRAKVKYKTCREQLLERKFPVVDATALQSAHELDRNLRAQARKRGRTQVLVEVPAKRARWANQYSAGDAKVSAEVLPICEAPRRRIRGKRPAQEVPAGTMPLQRPRCV